MKKRYSVRRMICLSFAFSGAFLTGFAQNTVHNTVLRINEFMAMNSTYLADEDGEYSDWIEIRNVSSAPVSLLNLALTDDSNDLQKWIFPNVTLQPDSFLIVFASEKNRTLPEGELHANFKLSGAGEYLALLDMNGNLLSGFASPYPEQLEDLSCAWSDSGYFITSFPSPGAENKVSGYEVLPKPVFSHSACFYDSPFEVSITSEISGARIFYTTDGSDPGPDNGTLYTGPVPVTGTTLVRAVAVLSGNVNKNIATQTYLFPEDIISQGSLPEGYPDTWGPFAGLAGTAPADYEMDPEVTTDPVYSPLIKDALLSLPSVSLVSDKDRFFSKSTHPDSGGIYIYTGAPVGDGLGKGWERPVSVEFINPDGSREFQIDAGVQLHGGHSRLPEKSPKHSFRIVFRGKYGPSHLEYPLFGPGLQESFNNLNLSASFGNSLYHHSYTERSRWQFIQDVWAKDTQLDMGQPAGHCRYVHLYINGLYWGIYNATERIDDDFAAAYLGGSPDEYDVMKDYSEVQNGERASWDEMMALAESGLSDDIAYQHMLGNFPDGTDDPEKHAFVDPVNLADYMILNFYSVNVDWDHHNWVALRNRTDPGKGFLFFSWDAEKILEDPDLSALDEDNEGMPSGLFQEMMKNAQFRSLFADRVQKHCFNGGALTPAAARDRYNLRAEEIELAVIAESARWGDYRRDVHRHSSGPYNTLYTREHWLQTREFIMNTFFPGRTAVFIEQLRQKGWFPAVAAPEFHINGAPLEYNTVVGKGSLLTMSASSPGDIYYTTDGADPAKDGAPSESAMLYSDTLHLEQGMLILARTFDGTAWSALSEFRFFPPSDLENLKLTEIHYHPLDSAALSGGLFEFVELKNTGTSLLDLTGVSFDAGIYYAFPDNTILEPGKFIVLASSPEHFETRYSFAPFGRFDGALDNSGELIRLTRNATDTLLSILYDDYLPWPLEADGTGNSLVPAEIDPSGPQISGSEWRASYEIHGSPGMDDLASGEQVTALTREKTGRSCLKQNIPNPFTGSTSVSYFLDRAGLVQLSVFNSLGAEVRTPERTYRPGGYYSCNFSAEGLTSGIYYYCLYMDGEIVDTKRMVLY